MSSELSLLAHLAVFVIVIQGTANIEVQSEVLRLLLALGNVVFSGFMEVADLAEQWYNLSPLVLVDRLSRGLEQVQHLARLL